jgi:hypothetical protein
MKINKSIVIVSCLILLLITVYLISKEPDKKLTNDESHKVEIKEQTSNVANLNLSILIDLSDRIDPTINSNDAMSFKDRDIAYITSVATAFKKHIISKRVVTVDDRIQVYFDPTPENNQINDITGRLKLELNKNNVNKEIVDKIVSLYANNISKIYRLAIEDHNKSKDQWPGSDLFDFFNNKINNYCIKPGYRNILIVLTDGYMFHKNNIQRYENKTSYILTGDILKNKLNNSDWRNNINKNKFGFIDVNKAYDLEVLLLSFNPSKNNPFEFNVLEYYWQSWLRQMKVKKCQILKADLPADLDETIQGFILNN